ncbi:DUF3120 domain-containing protein [Candidatus Synechococcus calcipolaris G9]|uniref:DUF3120 domain-containing protein n=1 Tax=Candidatus Synechococcus calcipolaris G9 TaxID=1497997 RepID=A0ABT6F2R5_9SYNE|nr:DUF3120 domain-containing protein [Candidatus Synechococcus calcipolaris]MDG2992138.1 DUF3120 domain-containing protein [Candidatus Synechococcus calcipolaris G9]
MSALTSLSSPGAAVDRPSQRLGHGLSWRIFAWASFLVSVPVFFQAPLVRVFPWISFLSTLLWFALSGFLGRSPRYRLGGDILYGFSWCWFAGSIYWGWLRWEPLWHLPVEAIALPIVLWHLSQRKFLLGCFFYLGSLLGTAITDAYFYLIDVIPHWRAVMYLENQPELVKEILAQAIAQLQTYTGQLWAVLLILSLLLLGTLPLFQRQIRRGDRDMLPWWGFMGAVLSTLMVDGLFGLSLLWLGT